MRIAIPTWSCVCGYSQDYDPNDVVLHALHHPGVPTGHCPACHLGLNPTRTKAAQALSREANPAKKCKVTVMEEADVDTIEVPDELNRGRMRKLTVAEKGKKIQEVRDAQSYWKARECKFTG